MDSLKETSKQSNSTDVAVELSPSLKNSGSAVSCGEKGFYTTTGGAPTQGDVSEKDGKFMVNTADAGTMPANHNSNKFVGDPSLLRPQTSSDTTQRSNKKERVKQCFTCGQNHGYPWCRGVQNSRGNAKNQNQRKPQKKQTTEHQVNKALYEQIQKQQGQIDALKDMQGPSAEEKAENEKIKQDEKIKRDLEAAEAERKHQEFLEERFSHIRKLERAWVEPHNCSSLLSIVPFALGTTATAAALSTSRGRTVVSSAVSQIVDLATNGKAQGFAASVTALLGSGALGNARASLVSSFINGVTNTISVLRDLKKRDTVHVIKFIKFSDYKHQDLRADDNSTSDLKHADPHYAEFEYTVAEKIGDIPQFPHERKIIVVSLELAAQSRRAARVGHTTDLEQAWLSFERACSTNTTVNISAYCEERSTRDVSWNVRHNTAFYLLCDHKYNTAASPNVAFRPSRSLV